MSNEMQMLLMKAVEKYGQAENIITMNELKKKWVRSTSESVIQVTNSSDLRTRSALMGLGQILEENLADHIYISTIKVGKIAVNEALLIAVTRPNTVTLVACAHEGLISEHIAEKAIEAVAKRLS